MNEKSEEENKEEEDIHSKILEALKIVSMKTDTIVRNIEGEKYRRLSHT